MSAYKSTTETLSSQRKTTSFFEKKRLRSGNRWKKANKIKSIRVKKYLEII